jgi:signal transduction histidine kinase
MKQFDLQRKIGIIVASGCFIIALFFFFTIYTTKHIGIFRAVFSVKVGSTVIAGVCFLLTSIRISKLLRYLQIFLFFSLAPLVFSNQESNYFGPLLLIMGYILSFKYGLLRKYFFTKSIAAFLFSFFVIILPPFLLYQRDLTDQMTVLSMIVIFLSFLWVIFEELESERKRREARLKHEINRNRKMGRIATNVGGLVHNLKNDISLITANIYMLGEEEIFKNQLHGLQNAVARLNARINRILLAIKADTLREKTPIDIHLLVCSIVEGFQVERDFKKGADVEIDIERDLTVFASISDISQIIENIISNSWDAIKKTNGSGKIIIFAKQTDNHSILSIQDNGMGIKGFGHSKPVSCMESSFFQVGKTTKEEGNGFGMVYVIETMRKYNGDVRVGSTVGRGTTVELVFEKD